MGLNFIQTKDSKEKVLTFFLKLHLHINIINSEQKNAYIKFCPLQMQTNDVGRVLIILIKLGKDYLF